MQTRCLLKRLRDEKRYRMDLIDRSGKTYEFYDRQFRHDPITRFEIPHEIKWVEPVRLKNGSFTG